MAKAARYTVAMASTGEVILANGTEKQAVALAKRYASPLTITRDDGVACEAGSRTVRPVGAPASQLAAKINASDAAVRDMARHQAMLSGEVPAVRESRDDVADYYEDVLGQHDRAERIRTGR